MKNGIFIVALSALGLTSLAYAAADGTAVGVKPDATADAEVLVVGSDVSVGERVVTGPSGRVELLFTDDTKIVVGPGSALVIEDYLLNGNQADRLAVDALAGTFRFISGVSPKSAYSIDTPTATIAVRGTEFDLTVIGRQSQVLLFEGALSLCEGSTCIDLEDRCDIAAVGGELEGLFPWDDPERAALVGYFPLPNIQSAFLPPFRVSGAKACLGTAAVSTAPAGGKLSLPSPPPEPVCDPRLQRC
jgi:hypothetical protein